MDDFMPATVLGYSEWPKNTPNYWALPAMADAVGWTYRKDWFSRPEIQAEFKKKYGRDLAPPKTYDELKQIAEFFQGREIDGKKVYGAYIFTERGSEGITMGVTNVLYDYGFEYEDPKKPYHMEGFVNSPGAVKGLEFYKELYKCCTRAGHDQRLHVGRPRRLQVGPGGDADELVRLLPGPLQGPERRRRQDRLLRQSGGRRSTSPSSAARASRSSPIPTTRTTRCNTSSGSPSPTCSRSGGSSAAIRRSSRCVKDPGFVEERAVRAGLPEVDGRSSRTSGPSRPMPSCCSTCRSASTTTSSPTRARRRRRSICWSRTGPKVFKEEGKID